MESLRTFVAIPIKVSENLALVWNEMRQQFGNPQVKWVSSDILHLTLFFLGSTTAKQVDAIHNGLGNALKGIEPFQFSLRGLGHFGPSHNPKIIWIGIDRSPELEKLQSVASQIIGAQGFPLDERGFNPHITLGRPRQLANPMDLINFLKSHRTSRFQTCQAHELIHFKSELRPSGPLYTPLYRIKL